MVENVIRCEDCRDTLKSNIAYDYIFCGPPEYDELGYDPNDEKAYKDFLISIFELCNPSTGIITMCLTDRKFDSRIISKSTMINTMMSELDYKLISHKILIKSMGVNLYRLNYSNVLTFAKKKSKPKQYFDKSFKPDVFEDGTERYDGFQQGVAVAMPKRCILNYTKPNDIVYDPFMGSGTTAIAALDTGRRYIGSEIVPDYCVIADKRIKSRVVPLYDDVV